MAKQYFGTDGIRGRANTFPMTAEVAMKVGMAAGLSFQRGKHRHRGGIGKDTRLSGYMIENAMVAGFCAAGMDVFLLGPVPTPAVAMLSRSLRADIGVMISASHNAFYDNGIKLFGPDGYKLSDEIETRIEGMLDKDLGAELASSEGLGRAKRIDGVHDRYIEFAKRTLPRSMSLAGMRIVIDCANGAAYKVAPAALWELGAEVFAIHDEPNGFNINDACGSTSPASLCEKVREVRADIGIALDGDAGVLEPAHEGVAADPAARVEVGVAGLVLDQHREHPRLGHGRRRDGCCHPPIVTLCRRSPATGRPVSHPVSGPGTPGARSRVPGGTVTAGPVGGAR